MYAYLLAAAAGTAREAKEERELKRSRISLKYSCITKTICVVWPQISSSSSKDDHLLLQICNNLFFTGSIHRVPVRDDVTVSVYSLHRTLHVMLLCIFFAIAFLHGNREIE